MARDDVAPATSSPARSVGDEVRDAIRTEVRLESEVLATLASRRRLSRGGLPRRALVSRAWGRLRTVMAVALVAFVVWSPMLTAVAPYASAWVSYWAAVGVGLVSAIALPAVAAFPSSSCSSCSACGPGCIPCGRRGGRWVVRGRSRGLSWPADS